MSLRNKVKEKMGIGDSSEPKSFGCGAFGCQMPGSICGSTHPSDSSQWLCRFHFGKHMDEWPEITKRVRAMTEEERNPTCKFQPANIDTKKLRFAQAGREWASVVIERRRIGEYTSDYGYALAKSVSPAV